MVQNIDDVSLMTKIAEGDVQAFEMLVDKYADTLYAFSWRLCMEKTTAEDLTQDVFLKIWKNSEKWKPSAKLSTWLYQVTYHTYVDKKRRKRSEVSDDVLRDFPDRRENPEEAVIKADTSLRVVHAINSLPESQKEALVLCYYQGLSSKEAAIVMETSSGAVESLLFRARKTLKKKLDVKKV